MKDNQVSVFLQWIEGRQGKLSFTPVCFFKKVVSFFSLDCILKQ